MRIDGTIYYSYLLRMWQVLTDGERTWRFQLENVQTGEKSGFASLEDLFARLHQVTVGDEFQMGEGNSSEVQG